MDFSECAAREREERYLGHDIIRVAQLSPANVRKSANEIPSPSGHNASLKTTNSASAQLQQAGRDTHHNSTFWEVVDGDGKGIADIHGPIIERSAAATKYSTCNNVNHQMTEEIKAVDGRLPRNSLEDLEVDQGQRIEIIEKNTVLHPSASGSSPEGPAEKERGWT